MKKVLFSALVICLAFTSCKKDDDGDDRTCQTCELDILGTPFASEYCDNGDGSISITTEGETQTTSLNGSTYAQFIAALKQSGATCK